MSESNNFFDTNFLIYLFSTDAAKADRADAELATSGVISVQVLKEFASVSSRRLKLSIAETREALGAIRAACRVVPISEETHDTGMQLAEKYALSIYDAMIVASTLIAGCDYLLSEDLQHGQIFEGRLRVRNPFRA